MMTRRTDRGPLPARLLIAGVALGAVGLAALCVVAWIPVWPCPLLEHFRVQYVAGGSIVVAAAAALRVRCYFDVALIATLLHALPVAKDLTARAHPGARDGIPLRVLVLNVHTASTSYDHVRQLIADEQPDVIGLLEVDARWLAALAPTLADYPARLEGPRSDNFGVALYARGRVVGAVENLGSSVPSVTADLAIRDARFAVILTHPVPPISSDALQRQRDQLDGIAERARATPLPLLVMGDLNATPWSRPFVRLRQRSGLCDSRAGFGVQASFPASSTLLRIPIDHVLTSCAVGVRDRRIGPHVGSDHLPVIVDLMVPRSS